MFDAVSMQGPSPAPPLLSSHALQARLLEREEELRKLQGAHERLWKSYSELKEEMALLKRRIFVAKAERVDDSALQLEFAELVKRLDELAGQMPAGPNEESHGHPGDDHEGERGGSGQGPSQNNAPTPGQGGSANNPGKRRTPKGRRNLEDSTLPMERVEVTDELFEQLVAEGKAQRIGFEESWHLGYRRGGALRIQKARVKYKTVPDEGGKVEIEVAPNPRQLWPRCLALASMLAYLATEKCHRGLPLYRIEQLLNEQGVNLDRGTMSRWLEELGATFNATIVHAMSEHGREHAFVQLTDATGFPIQPGRFDRDGPRKSRPCRKGHYFVRIADRDSIIFEYVERHTSANVRAMFRGFEGYVQADASTVFDVLFRPAKPGDPDDDGCVRIEVACWSHARRKYWEAAFAGQAVAREALVRINKIFEVDGKLSKPDGRKRTPPTRLKKLRDIHLRPMVEAFLIFAEREYELVKDERGALRSALGYTVRQAGALRAFLNDGRLRLDNNPSEGALRKVALLRDVCLFAGSDMHAQSQAGILSMVASARLHDLEVESYLAEVIRVLPYWPKEYHILLAPKFWRRTRALLDESELRADVGVVHVPDLATLARTLHAAQEQPRTN